MSEPNSPNPGIPSKSGPTIEELQIQLNVLEKKFAESKEPVVRDALQMRITQIRTQLGPDLAVKPIKKAEETPAAESAEAETEEAPEEVIPTPTGDQLLRADELIRQARVAKMRGQVQQATALIQQASEAAPGAPNILEILGDELIERKRYGEARVVFARAHKIDPANVSIERKYAEMVLRTSMGMSIETALATGDPWLLDSSEAMASAKWATVLSLMVPGAGHLALGENKKGIWLVGIYVFSIISVVLLRSQLAEFFQGHRGPLSYIAVVPFFSMIVCYVIAVYDCSSKYSKSHAPRHIDRPVPPANLPYE